ncbi:hypothetical protein Baya_9557 [Bagarius yarrelli]|uniref:Uncharacterized protein n=1 Tax=Bagarius yarrelli TaxID=175774 RepID=A0A556U8P0_BAGYA|nr:hypothetical protein Baya_9557 [Bagarius yarrelli]
MAFPALWLVVFAFTNLRLTHGNNRHAVYWNSSNIQLQVAETSAEVPLHEYRSFISPGRFYAVSSRRFCVKLTSGRQNLRIKLSGYNPSGERRKGFGTCRVESRAEPLSALSLGDLLNPNSSTEVSNCEKILKRE